MTPSTAADNLTASALGDWVFGDPDHPKSPESVLFFEIEQGNLERVKAIIESGHLQNGVQTGRIIRSGRSALMYAVDSRCLDIVSYLASLTNVNATHNGGPTALMRAIQIGFDEAAQVLIPLTDLALTDCQGSNALDYAIARRKEALVYLLLPDTTPNPNPVPVQNEQWLDAVSEGSVAVSELLLPYCTDLNVKTQTKRSMGALEKAVSSRSQAMVERILELIPLEKVNAESSTVDEPAPALNRAIEMSAMCENPEIFNLLRPYFNPDAKDEMGFNYLQRVVREGPFRAFQRILPLSDPYRLDKDGNSVLMLAISAEKYYKSDMVEELLLISDLAHKNNNKMTAIDLAREHFSHEDLIPTMQALLEKQLLRKEISEPLAVTSRSMRV